MATGDELDLRAVQQTPSQERRIARLAPHRSHLELPHTREDSYAPEGAGEEVVKRTNAAVGDGRCVTPRTCQSSQDRRIDSPSPTSAGD